MPEVFKPKYPKIVDLDKAKVIISSNYVNLITKIASKDTNVGARLFFLTLARSYLTGRAVAFKKVDVTFLEFCPLELHLHGRAFLSIFFLTRAQFI